MSNLKAARASRKMQKPRRKLHPSKTLFWMIMKENSKNFWKRRDSYKKKRDRAG
jgi:hypothetical protein